MFRFPFYSYPYNYQYYNYYNKYPNTASYSKQKKDNKENIIKQEENNRITNLNKISNSINKTSFFNSDQALFNILGIKLYLDDLIILALLFFLYQENVKDEMLYIILFLLLIS